MPAVINNSSSRVRVYNPIVTAFAQKYSNSEFVGQYLFPVVEHPDSGGNVIQFDDVDFDLINKSVMPGGDVPRIETGYEGKPFAKIPKPLDHPLPDRHRDDADMKGISWEEFIANTLMSLVGLQLEYEQSVLARTAANYAAGNQINLTTATDQFNDPNSNPELILDNAQEAIRAATGRYANLMLGGARAIARLRRHPLVKAQFSPTASTTPNMAQLAEFSKVDLVVAGKAVYKSGGVMTDVWGKDIILAYVEPSLLTNPITTYNPSSRLTRFTPNFGYTYTTPGQPMAINPYREERTRSDIYGVDFDRVPVLTGVRKGGSDDGKIISGYLIRNAVA